MKLQTLYLKFSWSLKKEPVFWIKLQKLNLKLFRKNYSSYNRIYMFLEYLISEGIFDIFSIVFQESTFKNSKSTEQKIIFQSMGFSGIIYSIKVFTRGFIVKNSFEISKDMFTSKSKYNFLKFNMFLVKKSKFMIHKKI